MNVHECNGSRSQGCNDDTQLMTMMKKDALITTIEDVNVDAVLIVMIAAFFILKFIENEDDDDNNNDDDEGPSTTKPRLPLSPVPSSVCMASSTSREENESIVRIIKPSNTGGRGPPKSWIHRHNGGVSIFRPCKNANATRASINSKVYARSRFSTEKAVFRR